MDAPNSEPTPPLDFRTAFCRWQGCSEAEFEKRVLRMTLFRRARLLRALLRPFRPHSFHAEFVLIKQAGLKRGLKDIELDIDFYQHKYVVGSVLREAMRFRVSGRTLMRLARDAFRAARGKAVAPVGSEPVQP